MFKSSLWAASAALSLAVFPIAAEAKASRQSDSTIIVEGKKPEKHITKRPKKGGKAGFRVEAEGRRRDDGTAALVRMEPGFQLTVKGDLRGTQSLVVAQVLLPSPVPPEWAQALAPDRARPILVPIGGNRMQETFWKPLKFRALFVPRDGRPMQVFDAPVNPAGNGFQVLMSPQSASALGEGSLLIVSNDGKWLLTTGMQSIKAKKVAGMKLKKGRIPDEFYTRYPSPVPALFRYDRHTAEGHAFFAALESTFHDRGEVYDSVYTGATHWQQVLAENTALNSFGDRLISCTSMQLGGMDVASLGTTALFGVIGGLMNGVLGSNDCLAKRRGIRTARK